MKKFSKHWKASKNPRKQRKYAKNAPLHLRKNLLSVNLSKDLKKKHNVRNVPVRKGDKVIIKTGQFKKVSGKVNRVDRQKTKVYVDGAERVRQDGTKRFYPIHPSNLQLVELHTDDKKRKIMKKSTKEGKDKK